MDPQAAWDEMLTTIVQRDWNRAVEASGALLSWMKKGGFPPQTSPVIMGTQWNRAMAEFGCLLALQLVNEARKRKQRKGSNE